MDKRKGAINVAVSIGFRILILISSLLARRFLIEYVGNGINGLNSLYSSILGFLAVAELGVGAAITFCMYQPIVEGDNAKVSALYRLFSRLYFIIGCIIFVGGCLVMPFLKYLAKGYETLDVNLYLTFFLALVAVCITYLFSAKTSLINAYKNNYISTAITSSGMIFQYVIQILVLYFTHSFLLYLLCAIIASALQWIATEIITRHQYGFILSRRESIDHETRHEIIKNVSAMFMHKIGGVLVNTADSVILSIFLGVSILGKYSNYTIIMTAMVGTINLFFTPLTSVIGHLYIEEHKEGLNRYYAFFHTFNFMIGTIFFMGYYAVIDSVISICFESATSGSLLLKRSVSFIITVNYFIQFMRQATLLFRDATGTFYQDRFKPLVEGIVNIILSVLFVVLLKAHGYGESIGVVGVLAATVLTNLLICHIVEPYVLYRFALKSSPKRYYFRNYLYIALFISFLLILNFIIVMTGNVFYDLMINGFIAVGLSLIPIMIAAFFSKDFRHYFEKFLKKIFKKNI